MIFHSFSAVPAFLSASFKTFFNGNLSVSLNHFICQIHNQSFICLFWYLIQSVMLSDNFCRPSVAVFLEKTCSDCRVIRLSLANIMQKRCGTNQIQIQKPSCALQLYCHRQRLAAYGLAVSAKMFRHFTDLKQPAKRFPVRISLPAASLQLQKTTVFFLCIGIQEASLVRNLHVQNLIFSCI